MLILYLSNCFSEKGGRSIVDSIDVVSQEVAICRWGENSQESGVQRHDAGGGGSSAVQPLEECLEDRMDLTQAGHGLKDVRNQVFVRLFPQHLEKQSPGNQSDAN
jgi:hypothetical protein